MGSKASISALNKQISDLKYEAEQEKVPLSPEVKKYLQEHLEKVRQKIACRQKVLPQELEFIAKIKAWIKLPQDWRQKHPGIDAIESHKKHQEDTGEEPVTSKTIKLNRDKFHKMVTQATKMINMKKGQL